MQHGHGAFKESRRRAPARCGSYAIRNAGNTQKRAQNTAPAKGRILLHPRYEAIHPQQMRGTGKWGFTTHSSAVRGRRRSV